MMQTGERNQGSRVTEIRQQQRVGFGVDGHESRLAAAQQRNEQADGGTESLFDLPGHPAHHERPRAR